MQLLTPERLIDLHEKHIYVEGSDIKIYCPTGQHIKPIHCRTTGVAFAIWSLVDSAMKSGDHVLDLSTHSF